MIFSITTIIVSLITVLISYLVIKKLFYYQGNLPPSPKGQWILNNLKEFNQPLLHVKINKELRKKFNKYMTLWIFRTPYVIINDYKIGVDLFVNHSPIATAGRAQVPLYVELTEGSLSVSAGNYSSQWSFQRKVFHSALRKVTQNVKLDEHTRSAFQYFKEILIENSNKSNSKGIFPYDETYLLAYNIFFAVSFGKTFRRDNPEFQRFRGNSEYINKFFLEQFIFFVIPYIHKFPFPKIVELRKRYQEMVDYTTEVIEEHKNQNTYNTDPQDTLDYVLKEKDQNIDSDDPNWKWFDISVIRQSLIDLALAGTDTTALTVNWMLGILATRREIVNNIRNEIRMMEEQEGREISIFDKSKMDYTCAVLSEIFRYSSLGTLSMRLVNNGVKLDEYDIPKGSIVMLNQYEFHHDTVYWENPEQFNPNRFLLNGKFVAKKDGYLPFSCGRRACLGENVAKSNLFLILCLICKELDITWTDDNLDSAAKENLNNSFMRYVNEYKILVKEVEGEK